MITRLGAPPIGIATKAASLCPGRLGGRLRRHLDRDIIASKGNIATPLLPQITEIARGCQLDVVESRPVQDPDCVLAHHVLPCQDLQQRRFACT